MLFIKKKYAIAFSLILMLLISGLSFSQNWNLQYSGTTKKLNSISSAVYFSWVCGDSGTVLRTTNNGTNWINVSGNGIPSNLKLIHIFSHKISPYLNERRYTYTTGYDNSGSYIYMTSNYGSNWNLVHTITGAGAKFNSIWFKDTLNGIAVGEPMGGRWQIWKTTNKGVNWDSSGLYLNGTNYSGFSGNLYGYQTDSFDSTLFLGVTYNGTESRVLKTINFGRNWSVINPGIIHPMTGIHYIMPGNHRLMTGGNKYYGYSTNGGSNWTIADSASFTSTQVCTVSNGFSSVSFILKTDTIGRQTVYFSWTNIFTVSASGLKGINHMNGYDWNMFLVGDSGKIYNKQILYPLVKKVGSILPDRFSLSQNYPNPFNPSTIIRFQIKDSRFVTLKVYDINGKEIITLVNEKLNPGEYESSFDGSGFPSGVYFYKLSTGNYSETKKMVLIK